MGNADRLHFGKQLHIPLDYRCVQPGNRWDEEAQAKPDLLPCLKIRKRSPAKNHRTKTAAMQSTLDHDAYIQALRPMTLEEKQAEFYHCREKAFAAAVLHDIELAEYYIEVLAYLSLFIIVEERLDIPARHNAHF